MGCLRRARDRQHDREGRALARDAGHTDRAAVGLGDGLHDREPQPAAAAAAGARGVNAVEALEQVRQVVGGATRPAVASATAMLVPGGVWARALASRFATAWRIRSSSPTRSEPPLELKLIGQSAWSMA